MCSGFYFIRSQNVSFSEWTWRHVWFGFMYPPSIVFRPILNIRCDLFFAYDSYYVSSACFVRVAIEQMDFNEFSSFSHPSYFVFRRILRFFPVLIWNEKRRVYGDRRYEIVSHYNKAKQKAFVSLGEKHELCADTFPSADCRRGRQGDSVLSAETEMDACIADVSRNLSRQQTRHHTVPVYRVRSTAWSR